MFIFAGPLLLAYAAVAARRGRRDGALSLALTVLGAAMLILACTSG